MHVVEEHQVRDAGQIDLLGEGAGDVLDHHDLPWAQRPGGGAVGAASVVPRGQHRVEPQIQGAEGGCAASLHLDLDELT